MLSRKVPSSHELSRWLLPVAPKPHATMRLLCFSHASGSASFYKRWQSELPASIDVCAIELPGHISRASEPPYRQLRPLVAKLIDVLQDQLDIPFALFGYSLGGLIAYELARELASSGHGVAKHLFVAAHCAPHLRARARAASTMSDAELLTDSKRLYGPLPAIVLDDPDLLSTVLGIMRADFELIDTYEHRPGELLTMAISAFGGLSDPSVPRSSLDGWRAHTKGPFRLHELSGSHFFIQQHELRIIANVRSELDAWHHESRGNAQE